MDYTKLLGKREIRFRVWDRLRKRWVPSTIDSVERRVFTESVFGSSSTRFVPTQFTGLYDRDGKEIWEGDVLYVDAPEPFRAVVRFDIEGGCWEFLDDENSRWNFGEYDVKVCDNIFEHPELLEQDQ